jgi:hypothetical protein
MMADRFKNPVNGHIEEVTAWPHLWALLFGMVYFLVRGLWPHVIIQLAVILIFIGGMGDPGLLFVIPMWIGYAIAAPTLIAAKYKRTGWIEVAEGQQAASSSETKACPYCAETVLAKAIKCKHCGSDIGLSGRTGTDGIRGSL